MKGKRVKILEKIPVSYSWFVGLAIVVILLIFFIAFSFFTALSENQLDSRKQFLNSQAQFAANEIQKSFTHMYEDMEFLVNNLDPLVNERDDDDQIMFERNIRRNFNNYRNIIDSIIVVFPKKMVSFYFDSNNNFVNTYSDSLHGTLEDNSKEIVLTNSSNQIRMILKLNLKEFLGRELSSYYVGSSGEKLLCINGFFYEVNEYIPTEGDFFDPDVFLTVSKDIYHGLKGEYEGRFIHERSGSEFQSIIHQYPFRLIPLESQFAVVFVQDREVVTSEIYVAYFSLFFGMMILLFFVIIILYKFNKNTQLSNKILGEKAEEINELFRRQTLLLQETKGFIYFHEADGTMSSVSKEVEDVLGYESDDFLRNYKNYMHRSDLKDLDRLLQDSVENQKDVIVYEFDFLKRNKEWIRVKIFEKLVFDEKGKYIGKVGICTDIQEKYLSEQELIKSENRLRAVLKSLPDLIFIYDHSGVYVDYYVQNEETLLLPASESIGKSIMEVLPEPMNRKFMDYFRRTVETGKMQTLELEIFLKVGRRIFETCLFKLDDQRVISIARDVTSQKLLEKGLQEAVTAAEQANRAKSEFLANMSHEIRTPMNGLLGIIDLLNNTPLSTKQKEYIEVIQNSGNSLSGIINDILDYSKIEAGMMTLNLSVFHFTDEIKKAFRIFSGLLEKKKIQFIYQFDSNIPEYIQLDKEKLIQVLLNLVGNAIKFTPVGGTISIHITEETISENIMLYFSIKDSGIGIPRDKMSVLGKPFVQVDGSNTREFSGTGLGLVISKKLIELMGGVLQVESEENVGSTFSFAIFGSIWSPATGINITQVLDNAGESTELEWENMAKKYPLNILLVEDNSINLEYMGMLMKELGYANEVARDGFEALEKVKLQEFDLIFMDIQMPKLNGLETTQLIRKQLLSQPIKIVGLSANAFEENIKDARASGMDDYLIKPVKIGHIAKKILECYYEKYNKKGVV